MSGLHEIMWMALSGMILNCFIIRKWWIQLVWHTAAELDRHVVVLTLLEQR